MPEIHMNGYPTIQLTVSYGIACEIIGATAIKRFSRASPRIEVSTFLDGACWLVVCKSGEN